MVGTLKNFTKCKNVRLPKDLYDGLIAEATLKGVGRVSTMARIVVLERLAHGGLDPLIAADKQQKIYADDSVPRITMHLTVENLQNIEAAADRVTGGNYSRLVQLVLWERYSSRRKQPKNKN